MEIKGSKTEANLKAAFSSESQAHRRHLYFAQKAEAEGYEDVAATFRSTAEGDAGHAHGHLEFLEGCGDPDTGEQLGDTRTNLKSAIVGKARRGDETYPEMAKVAREEEFDEIADWFEMLAKAEKAQATRFEEALRDLD